MKWRDEYIKAEFVAPINFIRLCNTLHAYIENNCTVPYTCLHCGDTWTGDPPDNPGTEFLPYCCRTCKLNGEKK